MTSLAGVALLTWMQPPFQFNLSKRKSKRQHLSVLFLHQLWALIYVRCSSAYKRLISPLCSQSPLHRVQLDICSYSYLYSLFLETVERSQNCYYLITGNNDDALRLSAYKNHKIIYIYTYVYKYIYLIICLYNNTQVLFHSLNHTANETLSCLFLQWENCSVG